MQRERPRPPHSRRTALGYSYPVPVKNIPSWRVNTSAFFGVQIQRFNSLPATDSAGGATAIGGRSG